MKLILYIYTEFFLKSLKVFITNLVNQSFKKTINFQLKTHL